MERSSSMSQAPNLLLAMQLLTERYSAQISIFRKARVSLYENVSLGIEKSVRFLYYLLSV